MRSLIITLTLTALLGAGACTKYKPDHDQVGCERVNIWSQKFTDSTRKVAIGDPWLEWPQFGSADNWLCDGELAKIEKAYPAGTTLCDVDGSKYYQYHFFTFQPR